MVDMNRNLVLNVLRTGAASRADVVRTTGLSPATVSLIVSELIESGLVNEVGEGKSSGGRPPLVLRLDDERNYVVGVKLMRHVISVAVTDLRAEVVYSEVVDLDPSAVAPVSVLEALCTAVEHAIRPAGVELDQVVGIGIGLAGLVDADTGVCRFSPSFGWREVPVAVPISERLGRPVLVDNDVNTLTVAEQWFGRGHGVDDFVVVTVGEGVGAGIVVEGRLYRGAKGAAGEIGHMRLDGEDAPCRCGGRGCLEAVSSDGAVRRYLAEAVGRGDQSAIPSDGTSFVTIAAVREAAEGGDEAAAHALERAGRNLGLGIASLVNLLNPRLVIISGEGAQAGRCAWTPPSRPPAKGPLAGWPQMPSSWSTPPTTWPGRGARPASSWVSCSVRPSTARSTWPRSPGGSRGPWRGGTERWERTTFSASRRGKTAAATTWPLPA